MKYTYEVTIDVGEDKIDPIDLMHEIIKSTDLNTKYYVDSMEYVRKGRE